MTHHADTRAALVWSQQTSRIAIGWGRVGDVTGYASALEITAVAKRKYPQNYNARFSGKQLWNFCYVMQPGDWVILSTKKGRAVVMQVDGNYEFRSAEDAPLTGDYQHQRSASRKEIDPDQLWLAAGGMATGQAVYWALIKCSRTLEEARARLESSRQTRERRTTPGLVEAGVLKLAGGEKRADPWEAGFGMFRDNPMFDEWQEAIREYRRERDAEDESAQNEQGAKAA